MMKATYGALHFMSLRDHCPKVEDEQEGAVKISVTFFSVQRAWGRARKKSGSNGDLHMSLQGGKSIWLKTVHIEAASRAGRR